MSSSAACKAPVDFAICCAGVEAPTCQSRSGTRESFAAAFLVCGVALLLAWARLPAFAQSAPSASIRGSSHPGGLYRIAGRVVNAITDEPVRRAVVAVLAEADSRTIASVVSDNEGHFALEGLPAAKYQLTASKRGFRTAFYDEHEEYNSAIVTGPDQETENLIFRLVPVSSIHGVVTADGGDPVEGAEVMLFLKPQGHNPEERITEAGSAMTDDTGAYEFGNLAAGEYLLAVKAEPWYALHMHTAGRGSSRPSDGGAGDALDVAYPITYFDSTSDESAAKPIFLAGGYREQANISLHAVPAIHIAVEAPRAPDGSTGAAMPMLRQSIFGAKALYENAGPVVDPQQQTVEFGGMAPGHYEIQQGDPPRIAELDANSSQLIDPSLGTPTFTISGTLRDASGAEVPDTLVLSFNPLDSTQHRDQLLTTCIRGGFSFPVVLPGTWELRALSPARQLPIASMTVGNRTHSGNLLTVRDHPLNVTVTVSQPETRIQGFAWKDRVPGNAQRASTSSLARKDGKGFAGAMVVLVPQNPGANMDRFRRDQSDSDGSFSLRDVAPGPYTVVAIEDGWGLDWARPEVIGRFLPRGIAVTITEQSGKSVSLSRPVPVQTR